jgi:hypothetical protein
LTELQASYRPVCSWSLQLLAVGATTERIEIPVPKTLRTLIDLSESTCRIGFHCDYHTVEHGSCLIGCTETAGAAESFNYLERADEIAVRHGDLKTHTVADKFGKLLTLRVSTILD